MVLLLWVLQGRALEWAHCGGQARYHSRRGTCRASAASTARANALGYTIAAILLHCRICDPLSTLNYCGRRIAALYSCRDLLQTDCRLVERYRLLHVLDAAGEQVKRTLHRQGARRSFLSFLSACWSSMTCVVSTADASETTPGPHQQRS